MDNSLSAFIAYFRQLAVAHQVLKGSFVHGGSGRIIAGSRSANTYPLLWLETPSLSLSDKDGTSPYGQRRAAFVVLDKASSSYADQDAKWASTEALALDVLSYLRRDRKARKITFTLDGGQLEAVATLTVDGEIGWRYEFELGDYVPLKFEASRWREGAPAQ